MELPSHPDSEEAPSHRKQSRPADRMSVVVFVVIGALLALMVLLHLTGVVGPGAH